VCQMWATHFTPTTAPVLSQWRLLPMAHPMA
jgi:hypothetical protein